MGKRLSIDAYLTVEDLEQQYRTALDGVARSQWQIIWLLAGGAITSMIYVGTNNNARNYGVVNALDLQELLGQLRGQGQQVPEGVQAAIQEREASQAAQAGADNPS